MNRVLCAVTVALSLWSVPASAFFAFEMPRLSFPSEQTGAGQVTRGDGAVVVQVPVTK